MLVKYGQEQIVIQFNMYNINFKREPVYQFGSLFLYLCCFAIDDGFALYSKGNYIKIKYRRITNYT